MWWISSWNGVYAMLARQHITLHVPQLVKDWLAERGYDPSFGARPLKRLIQTQLVNKLASLLIGRNSDAPAQYEVALARGGESLEFVEVYNDVSSWAK